MQSLLTAIKAQLQTDLTAVRDGDVFITPHADYVPRGVRPPCVGLKDGAVRRIELAGGMLEVRRQVQVVVFASLAKPEASVMGDAASGALGVLELVAAVHASLDENLLDIGGMVSAFAPAESPSEAMDGEYGPLQRKIVTYEYIGEEAR